jgi:hypothetical protein
VERSVRRLCCDGQHGPSFAKTYLQKSYRIIDIERAADTDTVNSKKNERGALSYVTARPISVLDGRDSCSVGRLGQCSVLKLSATRIA